MDDEIEVKVKQAAITPFWRKLPFFFAFPFRFGPLVMMAVIVGASFLAGFALGGFGLVFRGLLAYLGLRYAFNVLELFSRGRFEGESPDHRLTGAERRPAKFGIVIALFVTLALQAGDAAVSSRVASNAQAQDRVIADYRAQHAAELAQREREWADYRRQAAEAKKRDEARARLARESAEAGAGGDEGGPLLALDDSLDAALAPPPPLPSRDEMLEASRPRMGDALWVRLLPAWYWPLVLLASLGLPSAAIVIALEDSLLRALNPVNVLRLMQAMGRAYVVLWLFFLAIAGSRHLAFSAGASLPPMLRFPLEMALATYLGLVLFAIMGYALYQYHQELHLDVDVDFDAHREAGGAEAIAGAGSARAAIAKVQGPADPVEQKVQAALARGDIRDAIAEVKDAMRYDRDNLPLNARLHGLLVAQGDNTAVLEHGQRWLSALARAQRGREVLAALRKLLAIDASFTTADGDVVLPAASAAMEEHDFALATSLLQGFGKRFPAHKDTPAIAFLGARLMSEQGRQHDKAARLLRGMLAHFPEHPVAEDARRYLVALESMLAMGTRPA